MGAPRCQGTTFEGVRCDRTTWRPDQWCTVCAYPPGAAPEPAATTRDRFASNLAYRSPEALMSALANRAKQAAKTDPRYTADQRQRQFAYNRLLARLFANDPDGWCLKGGVALLARLPSARHSQDVDVSSDRSPDELVAALDESLQVDLADHLSFEIVDRDDKPEEMTGKDRCGVRIKVRARVGNRTLGDPKGFWMDLVSTPRVPTSDPDEVEAWDPVDMPGLVSPRWRVYPLADHVADKVAATFQRYGDKQAPSSRIRDLMDIVLVSRQQPVDGSTLDRAVRAEFERREIEEWPGRFEVPDHERWGPGWKSLIGRTPSLGGLGLVDAEVEARGFLDPLFAGDAVGRRWDPTARAWI